jgi:hypothetical protein
MKSEAEHSHIHPSSLTLTPATRVVLTSRTASGSGLIAEAQLSHRPYRATRSPSACRSSSAATRSLQDPESEVLSHRSRQEQATAAIFMTFLMLPAEESEGPTHSVPTYPSASYVDPDGQHIRTELLPQGCTPARKGRADDVPEKIPTCSAMDSLLGGEAGWEGRPGGEEGGGMAHAASQPSGVKPLR